MGVDHIGKTNLIYCNVPGWHYEYRHLPLPYRPLYLLALAAPDFQQSTRWIDITFQILAEALDKFGIGAKTSSGYGRMKFIDLPIKPLDPEMRIAESYKRDIDALKDVAGHIHGY